MLCRGVCHLDRNPYMPVKGLNLLSLVDYNRSLARTNGWIGPEENTCNIGTQILGRGN